MLFKNFIDYNNPCFFCSRSLYKVSLHLEKMELYRTTYERNIFPSCYLKNNIVYYSFNIFNSYDGENSIIFNTTNNKINFNIVDNSLTDMINGNCHHFSLSKSCSCGYVIKTNWLAFMVKHNDYWLGPIELWSENFILNNYYIFNSFQNQQVDERTCIQTIEHGQYQTLGKIPLLSPSNVSCKQDILDKINILLTFG